MPALEMTPANVIFGHSSELLLSSEVTLLFELQGIAELKDFRHSGHLNLLSQF